MSYLLAALSVIYTIICAVIITSLVVVPNTQTDTIQKVLQYQHECTNPYFYYSNDDHKGFCDKIHVGPTNSTGALDKR